MGNFLWFQLGWWLALVGGMLGQGGWSVLAATLLLGIHLRRLKTGASIELLAILICTFLGFATDLLAQQLGLVAFSPDMQTPWPLPLWLLAMWLVFPMTFAHSLLWFLRLKWWLRATLSGVAFPLSYLPGEAFGVLKFQAPRLEHLLGFGLLWALMFSIMSWAFLRIYSGRTARTP